MDDELRSSNSALLTGCFPSTAARYACRCAIPLPRSGLATELTVRICTIDRDPHKSLASDAAGNVGATGRNLTVRHGQRRAGGRLAAAGFGHDRDIPEPVIGALGEGRSGGEGGQRRRKPKARNAWRMRLWRMNQIPDVCDDAAYSATMCSKFAASRQHEKFPANQTFDVGLGSRAGTRNLFRIGQPARREPVKCYFGRFGALVANCSSCGLAGSD